MKIVHEVQNKSTQKLKKTFKIFNNNYSIMTYSNYNIANVTVQKARVIT